MKRLAEKYLAEWKKEPVRKPLILRGARQVGKTYIVREFSRTFSSFVELNFEKFPEAKKIFEQNFDSKRILRDLTILTGKDIVPGKTLLFFDEVQMAPNVIAALRYFYEDLPQLHVIAAGSLIDFALEHIGMPVGRVSFLYLYPLSFLEFLEATESKALVQALEDLDYSNTSNAFIFHDKLIESVAHYMAIGGMPEAVKIWIETNDIRRCRKVHLEIAEAYKQDFEKYVSKSTQLKYTGLIFNKIPQLLGQKVKYTNISKDHASRELAPCLDLLEKAGIIHRIYASSSQNPPLGATISPQHFKAIFLDVGLSQAVLGLDIGDWILHPRPTLENKGNITEAFVGQEVLAYSNPTQKAQLYYWHRETRGSTAEIDYVIQKNETFVPIEVKSGITGGLKSLVSYVKSIQSARYGVHFSQREHQHNGLYASLPLYAVSKIFLYDHAGRFRVLLEKLREDETYKADNWLYTTVSSFNQGQGRDRAFNAYDDLLAELDTKSWKTLEEKAIQAFLESRNENSRGKEAFFDCLNEAFGYLYLKKQGAKNIQFCNESGAKSPDLSYEQNEGTGYCEVKTINGGKAFHTARENNSVHKFNSDDLIKFLDKIYKTVNNAINQIKSKSPTDFATCVVYLILSEHSDIGPDLPSYSEEIKTKLQNKNCVVVIQFGMLGSENKLIIRPIDGSGR